jgi:hypothetical protein
MDGAFGPRAGVQLGRKGNGAGFCYPLIYASRTWHARGVRSEVALEAVVPLFESRVTTPEAVTRPLGPAWSPPRARRRAFTIPIGLRTAPADSSIGAAARPCPLLSTSSRCYRATRHDTLPLSHLRASCCTPAKFVCGQNVMLAALCGGRHAGVSVSRFSSLRMHGGIVLTLGAGGVDRECLR